MKKQPLNISDLISLDGLTKPAEGEPTMQLGGKAENVKKLSTDMSDFAEKMEDNSDVLTGDLASLAATMKQALARELSPENSTRLLKKLKTRFEKKDKFYKTPVRLNWEKIQTKLEANPEKLWSLNEMEKTGGEPDVLGQDQNTGEYIFMDCSAESPTGRRNCVYDREGEDELKKRNPSANYKSNAVSMAALMGVNLLSESEYRDLQTKGEFDKNSWSWLETPLDKRASGVALVGYRVGADVYVGGDNPHFRNDPGGFRGLLRV